VDAWAAEDDGGAVDGVEDDGAVEAGANSVVAGEEIGSGGRGREGWMSLMCRLRLPGVV
jgi:hypothetical protein